MKVREIVKADRESYRQLRSTLDKESPMWGAAPGERERLGNYAGRQFDEVIDSPRSIILVAEESGLLIGFISLETSRWKSLSGNDTDDWSAVFTSGERRFFYAV